MQQFIENKVGTLTIAMQEFIRIICPDFTTLQIGTNLILKNKINMVKTWVYVYIYIYIYTKAHNTKCTIC